VNILNAAIYNKLQAGTALTALLAGTTAIYNMQAPEGATYPYIIFSYHAGGDENLTNSRMKNYLYFIRGYSTVSAAMAGSIDDQIDALLHGGSLAITGYDLFWMVRDTDVQLVETLPNTGVTFMDGALYRIRFDK
jgi:hypothetical protein